MKLPQEIKRIQDTGLILTWDDGKFFLSSKVLRENCPSAVSKAKRGDTSHDKPLTPSKKSMLNVVSASIEEELKLTQIWEVGSYAIGMEWADGHNTGIYSYQFLRELCLSQGVRQ